MPQQAPALVPQKSLPIPIPGAIPKKAVSPAATEPAKVPAQKRRALRGDLPEPGLHAVGNDLFAAIHRGFDHFVSVITRDFASGA